MSTCMIDGRPAVIDIEAPVTLHGHAAPAGRNAYDPMRITLCADHVAEYHGERCEETVTRDGQPGMCGRPLDEHGRCGHERDHVDG